MILVSFCSSRYGYCDFFDPDTNYLAGAGGLARPYGNFFQQNVVKTGVYSLWVHNSTDTPIPVTYSLCWASDKQCSATPISFGQDFTVTLPPAQIRTYSFFANAHDFVRFYNGTMSTVGPDGGDFIDLNDLPATGTYMAFAKVDGCVAIPFTTRLCRYPKIIETPQDQDVSVGANVTFNVIASSSSTIGYQWRFNFTNIPGAINPTLILTNVTTSQSGIYDVLVYENANCMRGGGSANLSVNGISLHRLEGTALTFSPSDGVDMPLEVTHQAAILRNQPELGKSASSNAGLVADGVTPLLFKFTLNSDFRYTLSLSVAGGGVLQSGSLSKKLRILTNSTWVATTNLALEGNEGFAYIAPIQSEELILDNGVTELSVTLTARNVDSGDTITKAFKLRKPPIVLVHGYNADRKSWGLEFTNTAKLGRPGDFVIPIDYGVNGADPKFYINTVGRLDALAAELDRVLKNKVEANDSILKTNWAFTRYDIVGHSQGGVLARMLSSENFPPTRDGGLFLFRFRDADNFYRGRFHRVVTVGSPHNGSTMIYYGLRVWSQPGFDFRKVILSDVRRRNILQRKFDPFGEQIEQINSSPWRVDPVAKFALIRTTISNGQSPGDAPCPVGENVCDACPLFHYLGGLCELISEEGVTRGNLVLPRGSDGVVDFDSQGGGLPESVPVTTVTGHNLSHSSDDFRLSIFAVAPDQCQTRSFEVAEIVKNLLSGPESAFGANFSLPARVPNAVKTQIDSDLPVVTMASMISRSLLKISRSLLKRGGCFNFELTPFASAPLKGNVIWFADVFGTNGVSTDGVTLQVATNDSTKAMVCVEEAVLGDVILHASYVSTNGDLMYADPIVVVSYPVGALSGIELVPSAMALSVDDTIAPEIWGVYTNGLRSLLYISSDPSATFSSLKPNVASVDTNGLITANAFGTATLRATYQGFTAETTIMVLPPTGQPFFEAARFITNGIQMRVIGPSGARVVVEVSADLQSWTPFQTNALPQAGLDLSVPLDSSQKRFFRARLAP